MKKFNWNKVINILLIMAAATIIGALVAFAIINPSNKAKADVLNPIEVGVDFKIGKLERTAQKYNAENASTPNGSYTYNTTPEGNFITAADVNNGIFKETVSNGSYNMLYNYAVQNDSSLTNFPVENLYINFGSPYSEGNTVTRIISATGYLNGQQIEINPIKYEDYDGSGDPNNNNSYWYMYLDLTNIRQYNSNVGTGNLIKELEGNYQFNFTYFYKDAAGNFQGQKEFSYNFNLINQNSYYNNYPTFQNSTATRGKLDENKVIQYFYNFDKTAYPTYSYDASKYNVSYTRTRNKEIEEVTTSFAYKQGVNDVGILTITSSINGNSNSKQFEISKTLNANSKPQYLVNLQLSEFGVYNFYNKYVTFANNEFVVFDSIVPYDFTAIDTSTTPSSNPYETGKYAKGLYNLHVFGVKAYFTKNGIKTELRYLENQDYQHANTFVSDYSSRINEANTALSSASSSTTPVAFEKGFYNKLIDVNKELSSLTYNKNQNFPSTNLNPISFDYFGNFYYENNITPASFYNKYSNYGTDASDVAHYGKFYNATSSSSDFGYITKDTYLNAAGYYEVVVKYTYSEYEPLNNKPLYNSQAFVFHIDNSSPETTIYTTNRENPSLDSTVVLKNSNFTNQAVFINWTSKNSYFNAPIRATITKTDFNGLNPVTTNYVKGNLQESVLFEKGKYTIKIYFGEGDFIYNSYTFTIDTDPISTPQLLAVDAIYDKENANIITNYQIAGTDKVDFNNSNLINQPFTIAYEQKDSGAKITTTYQKIPFRANSILADENNLYNGAPGTSLNSENKYILTNYNIDYKNISTKIDYSLNYDKINNGEVAVDNIFNDTNSFIYLFTMTDQAGNTTSTFVIYDLTKPYAIVDPAINNPYNIVSSEANVIWGTHKMVPVLNSNTVETDNDKFFNIINNYNVGGNKLFKLINNVYYMSVPITNVKFTYTDKKLETYQFNASDIATNSQVTLFPKLKTGVTDAKTVFFSGEKIYDYIITDYSNITSFASLANSNKTNGTIWMNLDNSIGIAYANYGTSSKETGQAIRPNATTGANQLRFSYIPGTAGSDYYVKNVSFTYYEFSPNTYTTIDSGINITNAIPTPTYPYAIMANITDRSITLDNSLKVEETTNSENNRVISNIINPTTINGNIVTKEGMYVIKREYEQNGDINGNAYENDSIIRYYVYYVDRNGIIDISPEAVDEEPVGNPTADSIIYEVGNGINFKFTNNQADTTKYSAKDIQQYIEYVGSINIFDSNKLPVKLNLPKDKFNTTDVLLKAANASDSGISTIISQASERNNTLFQLKYKVKLNNNVLVLDTTGDNNYIDNNYVISSTVNGIQVFEFRKSGIYNVELYDNSNALLNKTSSSSHKPRSINFNFEIKHEAPAGNYYGRYDDATHSDKLIEEIKYSNYTDNINKNNQYFESTNNKALKFVFKESENKYKAKIDPTNIVVTRSKNHGLSYETIYQRVNQEVNNTDPCFTYTTDANGLRTYTLIIYDGYEDKTFMPGVNVQDEGEYVIRLQFYGTESDYNAVDEDGNNINYFYKNFRIMVDTTKPEYNYNQLKEADKEKFNAFNNATYTNTDKYFFAVTPEFEFVQHPSVYNELDSKAIFVRKIWYKNGTGAPEGINVVDGKIDFPDYEPTITPDDPNYNNGNYKPNSPRFSEVNPERVDVNGEMVLSDKYYLKRTYPLNGPISITDLISNSPDYGSGYYEIVERDEAGNYRVYAIQYNNLESQVNQELTYNYTTVGKTIPTTDSVGGVKALEYIKNVSGNNLTFTNIASNSTLGLDDYFYKCIIETNGEKIEISNDPYNTPYNVTWNTFLNKINDALEFSKTLTKNGYNIKLTFMNRFSANYVINYNVPGDRLQPIFKDEQVGFTITIPNTVGSTYINQFKVYRFVSGKWETVSIDSNKKPITDYISDTTSLGGASYYFSSGEFKFVLIDNFGRGNEEDKDIDGNFLYPPYYKGVGVEDINSINYGEKSETIDGITYTANTVTLDYNQNLYTLEVYLFTGTNGDGTNNFQLITSAEYKTFGITETMSASNKTTLTFTENSLGNRKRFKIVMNIARINIPYVYNFVVTKELPNIEFRNNSGGNISTSSDATNPTVHTEGFIIRWNSTLFNPHVDLVRTYTDSNGKLITENINNIDNGYQVSLVGSYTAKITNSLGYTNLSKNVYFKLVDGEVIVYDVIAITNNIESSLKASPKSDIVNINGKDVVVYKYYALNTYNNTDPNKKIEIRLNKNKGIEMQVVSDLTHDNITGYRIYGTSNYAYERYIEIIFIDAIGTNANNTFNVQIRYPQYNEAGAEIEPATILNPNSTETMTDTWIEVTWNSYNVGTNAGTTDTGNVIFADYYFNNEYVKSFSNSNNNDVNSVKLTSAGIHKFIFRDLAGNVQYFVKKNASDKFDYMTINLVNNALFTINNDQPIQNKIFNDDVILEITNRNLYGNEDPKINVKRNGLEYVPTNIGTNFYTYEFSGQGYYEVLITIQIEKKDGTTGQIITKYNFSIINPNQAMFCFNVPQNNNFRIVSLKRENSDITNLVENPNELWLTYADFGAGKYNVTLETYVNATDSYKTFSFSVWINDETPYLRSSIDFGTSTTKEITIAYNPKLIFDQIGESYIQVTGIGRIDINSSSENSPKTLNLTQNKEYWIQVFTSDDKLVVSYKVTKTEPLNTVAIIVIVVAVAVTLALTITFILIRRKKRFK